MRRLLLLPFTALLASCGGGTTPGPLPAPTTYRAYAVTDNALYSLVLSGPGSDEKRAALNTSTDITDLAWDGSTLYAVTYSQLIRIDPATGAITPVGNLSTSSMNALTADAAGNLYGSSVTGTLYRVNKTTGTATSIGAIGYPSSGDLAFDANGTLYATVKSAGFTTDALATLNVTTGRATLIGDTGYSDVYGLNVQGGVMYGLTLKGQLLTLNVTSGAASVVRNTGLDFTGMQ